MNTALKITATLNACMLIAGLTAGYAQDGSTTEKVKEAIHQYYRAMESRDMEALQNLLHPTFIVIESGRENAKVHVVDTGETSKLLPPDGNNDWENLQLTDLNVSLSSTHPSVATVSYSVFHPTDPRIVEMLQDDFKRPSSELDDLQRKKISKLLTAGGSKESECAMLALCDGIWKIVSMSVPK